MNGSSVLPQLAKGKAWAIYQLGEPSTVTASPAPGGHFALHAKGAAGLCKRPMPLCGDSLPRHLWAS